MPTNEQPPVVLGLDIGGTKLAAGVIGMTGSVLATNVTPTDAQEGPQAVLNRLFELGRSTLTASGIAGPPQAIGIGCGGPLDRDRGILHNPPLLPGWDAIDIVHQAETALGASAFLDNDGTAAALAEYRHGAGRGTATMLYLTISTGVGGGAILNGQPYRGRSGNSCEFGHLVVQRGGIPCVCGRNGCLQAYVSGTSIAARTQAALAAGTASSLQYTPTAVTAADVVSAVQSGDQLARAIWTETTELLGSALTDLTNIFEPDRIILGGGVTRAGRLLLDPCTAIVARDTATSTDIALAGLGDLVGVIGAAQIAVEALA